MAASGTLTGKKNVPAIRVTAACTRCKKCVNSCPAEILVVTKERGTVVQVTDANKCFECRACEVICPASAIEVN